MSGRALVRRVFATCLVVMLGGVCFAAPWIPSGPDGGDARQIVSDPHDQQHLYLGTTDGWLYQTHTMGSSWQRVSQVGGRNDLVIDSIVLDPRDARHIVIGAWVIGAPDGGVFVSHDGGATWSGAAQMQGQSVRALKGSPSNPDDLVAGTLQGVFRSTDNAQHWIQISPKDSKEIHEIESIAIDPVNPDVVYAGTWHLPWKTTDGGKTWANIKQGIIDDSDVFSIIVDPAKPATVYASACSGIYKSENAGDLFKKVQGIPSTARRTRALLQDPSQPDIVFAGTTEGLWRSTDAGTKWTRTTGPELIVNDVWIAPGDSKRVLISTDRSGVLASDDGGNTFHPSNSGFSARQVAAVLRDRNQPDRILVGVVNDKAWGGVFESSDGGQTWTQQSDGLEGRDVFALGQASDGSVVAGTSHGVYLLDSAARVWNRVKAVTALKNAMVVSKPGETPIPVASVESAPLAAAKTGRKLTARQRRMPLAAARHRQRRKNSVLHNRRSLHGSNAGSASGKRPVAPSKIELAQRSAGGAAAISTPFDGAVYAVASAGDALLATTSEGLLRSADQGRTWTLSPWPSSGSWQTIAGSGQMAVAASGSTLFSSVNAGADWTAIPMPQGMAQISTVAAEPTGELWVGGPAGAFVSSDSGKTWIRPRNLYVNEVSDVFYDSYYNRVYVSTGGPDSMIFTMQLPQKLVLYTRAGWALRLARQARGHLVGSTRYDGMVVQPQASDGTHSPLQAAVPLPAAGPKLPPANP